MEYWGEKTIKLLALFGALLLQPVFSFGQEVTTEKSLLNELINRRSVVAWTKPFYSEYQASSYDRHSVSPGKPGWFANADFSQYIRTEENEGRTERVMLDVSGPGAIVRFWLTTGLKRNGILRIYFDNESKPAIKINSYDLMKSELPLVIPHASYQSNGKGGSTLYLPLPFEKHCKITWQDFDTIQPQPRYYQINYRKYVSGTKVKTFTFDQLSSLRNIINRVNTILWNPVVYNWGVKDEANQRIEPGKEISLRLPEGPKAIMILKIIPKVTDTNEYAQILRSTILRISFDGKQTVWCPIGDFSGSGVGGKPLQSWYRTVTNNGEIISRWIMPYKRSATLSLLNLYNVPVEIAVKCQVNNWQWNASSMYFHVSWKMQRNVPIKKADSLDAVAAIDWNLNTIKGKGVYVGNTLAVYNNMHVWYGEGDMKIWVDNNKFPVEFGTGTEDYYNASWAPVTVYQTPFANAPRADNNNSFGYNTFTRTLNLDAIPFQSFFKISLEMLGWKNGTADFAATTYWYGFAEAKDNCGKEIQEAEMSLP